MSVTGLKQSTLHMTVALVTTLATMRPAPALATATPTAPLSRYASIVMDADTGTVLYERNADLPRHPASLTKIMTLYLAFEALATKKLSLTDELPISAYAAGRDPSRLDLAPGSRLKVEDAIRAITTKSANDAACAIAEALGGSERQFAQRMTSKAKALGLSQTIYLNASGLPEDGQLTSARDLAVLCRAMIRKYPDYYRYFATGEFDFHGTRFPNQNRFLHTYYGADGIKTGFVNASGHNLAASAVRGGKRLIAIVLGGETQSWTREHATRLLDVSYAKIDPSLVMVASNAANCATDEAEDSSPTVVAAITPTAPATPPPAPSTQASQAPAPLKTTGTPPAGPLPLPNATANLTAFVAGTKPADAGAAAGGASAVVTPAKATTNGQAAVVTPVTTPVDATHAHSPLPGPAPTNTPATHSTTVPQTAAPTSAPAAAAEENHAHVAPAGSGQTIKPTNTTSPVSAPATSSAGAVGQQTDRQTAAPAIQAAPPNSTAQSTQATGPAANAAADAAQSAAPATAAATSSNVASTGDWSVQVGLFRDATVARRRGEEARRQMPLQLRGADLVIGRAVDGVHVTSRISRLSEQDARAACSELQRGRVPCVVVPPGRPLIVATN